MQKSQSILRSCQAPCTGRSLPPFRVAEIIAHASQGTTLQPGTVILTGTPAGVGVARSPPIFLGDGDVVEVAVEGVGTLTNRVTVQDSSHDVNSMRE